MDHPVKVRLNNREKQVTDCPASFASIICVNAIVVVVVDDNCKIYVNTCVFELRLSHTKTSMNINLETICSDSEHQKTEINYSLCYYQHIDSGNLRQSCWVHTWSSKRMFRWKKGQNNSLRWSDKLERNCGLNINYLIECEWTRSQWWRTSLGLLNALKFYDCVAPLKYTCVCFI